MSALKKSDFINGYYVVESKDHFGVITSKLSEFGETAATLQSLNGSLKTLHVGQVIYFKNKTGTINNQKPLVYQEMLGQPFNYLHIRFKTQDLAEKTKTVKSEIDQLSGLPNSWLLVLRQNKVVFSDLESVSEIKIKVWGPLSDKVTKNNFAESRSLASKQTESLVVQDLDHSLFLTLPKATASHKFNYSWLVLALVFAGIFYYIYLKSINKLSSIKNDRVIK